MRCGRQGDGQRSRASLLGCREGHSGLVSEREKTTEREDQMELYECWTQWGLRRCCWCQRLLRVRETAALVLVLASSSSQRTDMKQCTLQRTVRVAEMNARNQAKQSQAQQRRSYHCNCCSGTSAGGECHQSGSMADSNTHSAR